jgi:hypothetical protein
MAGAEMALYSEGARPVTKRGRPFNLETQSGRESSRIAFEAHTKLIRARMIEEHMDLLAQYEKVISLLF